MSDDDDVVFEAVRARVGSGECLDEVILGFFYPGGVTPLSPATEEAVRACEALLGRPLPRLLRRCYRELGDGGFGPAYGLLPLGDGRTGVPDTVTGSYRDQRGWRAAWQPMAGRLLPVCDWGCHITSFVDCHDPAARMWALDPNPAPQDDPAVALFPQPFGFTAWLRRWTEGTLRQPTLVRDEVTGTWRGATDAECDAA